MREGRGKWGGDVIEKMGWEDGVRERRGAEVGEDGRQGIVRWKEKKRGKEKEERKVNEGRGRGGKMIRNDGVGERGRQADVEMQ